METNEVIEWESISFPITLTSLVSETGHYKLPFDGKLEVTRDCDYDLIGVISGVLDDTKDFEYREEGELVEVGFMKKEIVSASDGIYNYELENFHIKNIQVNGMGEEGGNYKFSVSSEVSLDFLKRKSKVQKEQYLLSEFYLCFLPQIILGNRTSRYDNAPLRKVREDIDPPLENEFDYIKNGTYSSSWDYAVIDYKEHQIIIQQVNENYLPNWSDGLQIEYRNVSKNPPSDRTRRFIRDFISFIIGSRLQLIGETVFTKGYEVISTESGCPWGATIKKGMSMHPIPLKYRSRDGFQNILNDLLPKFESVYFEYSLSDCLWKLWIGSEQTLGTNLPTIASGLESLVDSYLEKKGLLKKYSKVEKQSYKDLISEELNSLEAKLETFEFGKFVLNKLKNPYNYGVGEKMRIFFDEIKIDFGKKSIENQAMQARNKMAHQNLEGIEINEILKMKKLSDAYISLLHRVILRLMDYEGYYIDYSKAGVKYLKMNQNL